MVAVADSQSIYGSIPDLSQSNPDGSSVLYSGFYGYDWIKCVLFPETTRPPRHGQKYNVLFCDAHVTAMDPLKLFNPTNSAAEWNCDHQPHPDRWMQTWGEQ